MKNHYSSLRRNDCLKYLPPKGAFSRSIVFFCFIFSVFSIYQTNAQDNLVSTTGNTNWVKPTFTVNATQTGSAWTNLSNVTANNSDFTYVRSSTLGAGVGSTSYSGTFSLTDGNTYGTTPMTGYRVGFVIDRKINNTGIGSTVHTGFSATIRTYLGTTLQETYTVSSFSTDISFSTKKDFDKVEFSVTGEVSRGGLGTGSGEIHVTNAYLSRTTRTFACNTPTPLGGPGLSAQATGAGIWTGVNNLEDNNSNTHALYASIIQLIDVRIKDDLVSYPAGTFAGLKVGNTGILGASILSASTVATFLNGVQQETANSGTLLSGSILNSDGTVTVGFRTTKEFDEIRYSTVNFGLQVLTTTTVYYPVIIRFCDNPITSCNTNTYLTQGDGTNTNYPVYVNSNVSSAGCIDCVVENPDFIVDNDFSNHATIRTAASVLSTAYIGIHSAQTGGYPIGTFVGFDIQDVTLAAINVGTVHKITLYRNGTEVYSFNDGGALGAGSYFTSSGRQITGFKSPVNFDEVRMTTQSLGGVGIAETQVYGVILKNFCTVADNLTCNAPKQLTSSNNYPIYIDATNTGIFSGVGVQNNLLNTSRLIDGDAANFAEIILQGSLSTSAAITVANGASTYPANTFAGFDIENSVLIGANALSGITITTLNANGGVVQTFNSSTGLISANSSAVSGSGRQTVGFLATLPFSRIKLTVSQTAGLSLGTIRVYGAVIQEFCTTALTCDVMTPIVNNTHPVYVNGIHTGIDYAGCAGCSLNNSQNVVNSSTSDYATMILAGSFGTSSSFAVANAIDTYPVNSFAGFEIATARLSADFLSSSTIELYNNGSLVQTGTGNALILGALNTGVSDFSRQIVGTVANVPYDEVRIVFTQVVGGNLGEIRIYDAVMKTFCPSATLACDETVWLNSVGVVNSARTGMTGAASAGGSMADPWNVVSTSTSDFTRLSLPGTAGVSGSVSVAAPAFTFPAGTTTGFFIKDVNNLAQGSLFNSITIRTYNNGVLQQTSVQGNIINVAAIIPIFGPGGTVYSVGFTTNQAFDEVRIEVASLGGIATVTDIYGAFVTTYGLPGCGSLPVSMVSFGAKAVGSNAELNWVTASERNSAFFEVQHSTNNQSYETIATLNAKGDSKSKTTYTYTHLAPAPSLMHYYRIKQSDKDGSSTIYGPKTVKFDSYVGIQLKAATTPSRIVKATISYGDENLSNSSRVSLVDLMGRKLSTQSIKLQKGENTLEFDGASLNSGVYLIQLENDSQKSAVKVVIQ